MRMTAQQIQVWASARRYLASGFSLIPCRADKSPHGQWREYTVRRPTLKEISIWFEDKQYPSIGLIGGRVSHNVVFIDLDGIPAIREFANAFPNLCENTRSILTGSQEGIHLYVRVDEIPDNINVRVEGIGGFEIRANCQYVIAPPSPHPSGHNYRVYRGRDILHLPHIHDVRGWMETLRQDASEIEEDVLMQAPRSQIVSVDASKSAYLNTAISREIERIKTASDGNRNNSLFKAALKMASYAAGGEIDWMEVSYQLLEASTLPMKEAERTIDSAYRIGSKNPKVVS